MTIDIAATADWITTVQRPDGAIPADHRGELDPWNHVEAAMGLDTAGRHDEAARAYHWLAGFQNPDGSWYAGYRHNQPTDHARDTSFTAYIAVGALHHYLSTQDTQFLTELWPTIDRAIAYTLTMQRPTGEFAWRQAPDHSHSNLALLTGNSSIHLALRCAITLADRTGNHRPQWIAATGLLRRTINTKPDLFAPKPHAMDWYYPILGAALDNTTANEHLDKQWHRFVVPHHGVRCVHHEPWVTAAETAELALTLATRADIQRATELLNTLHHLQNPDGSYWTGHNYATNTIWPRERTTWTAGAILLATAALGDHQPTLETFNTDVTPTPPANAIAQDSLVVQKRYKDDIESCRPAKQK